MKKDLEKYFDRLFPICRSITGDGLRQSFKILKEIIPLELTEVPTGEKVFDWEVPQEWNIRDAYIITPSGKKICQFKKNNLHVLNYSSPINKQVSYKELCEHLHTLPKQPSAIPYVTSYYRRNWGFCMSHQDFEKLEKKGTYKVLIDSELKSGSMTYGDLVLPGKSKKEILFSSYLCHPSMANNELSGPLVMAFLYKKIAALKNRKYTYRFVLAPETIGVIAYLFKYGFHLKTQVDAGFVITCAGTDGLFTYKQSRIGNSLADKVAEYVLKQSDFEYKIIPFDVGGSDERQYGAPGFNLPVGSMMRAMYKEYPEYHTSLDNKNRISFEALEQSVNVYFDMVRSLELNDRYWSTNPFCEPQLGKRNLYPVKPGKASQIRALDMLYLIAYADGAHEMVDVASKRNLTVNDWSSMMNALLKNKLLISSDEKDRD